MTDVELIKANAELAKLNADLATDKIALLEVVRLAKEAEGRAIGMAQTQEFHRAYAALPQHLQENANETTSE